MGYCKDCIYIGHSKERIELCRHPKHSVKIIDQITGETVEKHEQIKLKGLNRDGKCRLFSSRDKPTGLFIKILKLLWG